MKKFSIFMALAATVLGFTACSDDSDPVFQKPTKFVLNTPAMADQYYELTPEGSIELTCSQPDYGFIASTTYGVQIALDKNGPVYDIVPQHPTQTKISISNQDVATGMCVLRGIDSKDNWVDIPAAPLYIRATAQIGDYGESMITSDWITLKQVKGYFAIPEPGFIYLVGQPEGWAGPVAANEAHYADWRLFEKPDAIGSKVYYAVFDIPAGQAMFRFYTSLSGWDEDSYGSQEEDSPMNFEFTPDGTFQHDFVKGKGSFNFPDWAGGEMTIVVNMSNMTINIMEGNQL